MSFAMPEIDCDLPPYDLAHFTVEELRSKLLCVTIPPSSKRAHFSNWGKTYACTPLAVFEPHDEEQCHFILELARREGTTVRAAGILSHSPSDLACTTGYLVRTERLERVLQISPKQNFITVEAGISLHAIHEHLERHGLAMSNVGSISDQSLGGVVATGTHGTGIDYAVIPDHVLSLTILIADGSRVRCSRHERQDLFWTTLSGLGSTGFVLTIKLSVEPAFRLREVQEMIDFEDGISQVDVIANSAEHVRIWWFPRQQKWRVMASNRTLEAPNVKSSWFWDELIGFHFIQFLLFMGRFCSFITALASFLACWLMSQSNIAIDVSHRIFNLDCRYPQYTIEWAIPYDQTKLCLLALREWIDHELADAQGVRPHFPIEIRFTKSDEIWLSPSHGQKTTWIGLVQYKPYNFPVPYRRYFQGFAAIVIQHGGRPHWAKEHPFRSADLRRLYPRFDDFITLIRRIDPQGIFRNEYVRRHFFDEDVEARMFKDRP